MTKFPKIDVWGSEGPIDKVSKALGAFYAPRAEQRRIVLGSRPSADLDG